MRRDFLGTTLLGNNGELKNKEECLSELFHNFLCPSKWGLDGELYLSHICLSSLSILLSVILLPVLFLFSPFYHGSYPSPPLHDLETVSAFKTLVHLFD